jgi:hypothetical protein
VKNKIYQFLAVALVSLASMSCSKSEIELPGPIENTFKVYNIPKGEHYCKESTFSNLAVSEIEFTVQFDSSAIYKTTDPNNQYDINKLWGFTEGTDNHLNSARIGWSFNENQLRLYGYAYADGNRNSIEIATININQPIKCGIKVADGVYVFTVNGITRFLPRTVIGKFAVGYKQFPYFGGDEPAPHDVTIMIKEDIKL